MNILLAEMSWPEIIQRFWPVAAISFGVSLLMTPVCRAIARRRRIVDRPDEFLKPHGRPIPYLGGVAIFLGWLAGIIVALRSGSIPHEPGTMHTMLGILLAGTVTMLVGLFDDLRVMPARVKLVFNIVVTMLLLAFGLGTGLILVFTEHLSIKFEPGERWLVLMYSVPLTLMIVVGSCNATNLIDGLDGLCTGVLGIISIGFFVLATHLQGYSESPVASERVVLALAMLGAAAGFLPFNRNPATIFMGDAGSMLLGLNTAVIILLFAEDRLVRWMIGSLMVFGLPIGDMLLTLARRWRNGRPLMQGDRSHFYDQLRDRGFSVRQVVIISYLLTLAFVLVGTSVIFLRTRHAILVYAAAFAAAIAAIWKFNMAGIEGGRPAASGSSPPTEGSECG